MTDRHCTPTIGQFNSVESFTYLERLIDLCSGSELELA